MTRTFLALTLVARLAAAQALEAAPPGREHAPEARLTADFARSLADRGDHYRAIGEYERALFLDAASPDAGRWEHAIAESYRQGEQFDAAVRAYDALAASRPEWRPAALLGAAKAELAANHVERAIARAREAATLLEPAGRAREARWVEAWALLKAGRDAEAKAAFEAARGGGLVGEGAERALAMMPGLKSIPHRSPALAGTLGIVPGLGHLYIGEPGSAVSALAWNGVFAWALYDAIREQRWSLAVVLGMFEAMWYGGSIVGATSGAHRFNHDARTNALEEFARSAPPTLVDDVVRTSR